MQQKHTTRTKSATMIHRACDVDDTGIVNNGVGGLLRATERRRHYTANNADFTTHGFSEITFFRGANSCVVSSPNNASGPSPSSCVTSGAAHGGGKRCTADSAVKKFSQRGQRLTEAPTDPFLYFTSLPAFLLLLSFATLLTVAAPSGMPIGDTINISPSSVSVSSSAGGCSTEWPLATIVTVAFAAAVDEESWYECPELYPFNSGAGDSAVYIGYDNHELVAGPKCVFVGPETRFAPLVELIVAYADFPIERHISVNVTGSRFFDGAGIQIEGFVRLAFSSTVPSSFT